MVSFMRRTPVNTLVQIWDSLREFVLISPGSISKASAKRSQHLNTTYPDIVGPAFASSGQTIATSQTTYRQHCWAQHVARVWLPSCDVLWHAVCCWFKFAPKTPSCHNVSTWSPDTRNMLRPTMLRYVAFSNSLIIHQVKTKKIISVKEVWIPGLN